MSTSIAHKYGYHRTYNFLHPTTDRNFPIYVNKASRFVPLIDGQEVFSTMERYTFSAQKFVMMAFWDLNLDTPLLDPTVVKELTQDGYATLNWLSLIHYKLRKGVEFYILINTLDPVIMHDGHMSNWATYYHLYDLWKTLPTIRKKSLQFFCQSDQSWYHPLLQKELDRRFDVIIKKWNNRYLRNKKEVLDEFKNSPGLWWNIKLDISSGKFVKKGKTGYTLYFSSTHQKQIIVDNEYFICGGMDLSLNRVDNREHDKKFRAKYKNGYISNHDVSCLVQGKVVQDAVRSFIGLWNHYLLYFAKFVRIMNKSQSNGYYSIQIPRPLDTLSFPFNPPASSFSSVAKNIYHWLSPQGVSNQPIILTRLERTITERDKRSLPWLRILPYLEVDHTYRAIEKAIGAAEEFIYIENQFLRSKKITKMITDRYYKNRKLKVIIVLPFVPEEYLYDRQDEIALHGMFLQEQNLKELKSVMGSNVGLYTLWDFDIGNMIFVHSKLMIVDDVYSYIGSANFNDRSLLVDNEIGISTFSKMHVTTFRHSLWKEHLGMRPKSMSQSYVQMTRWKPVQFISEWDKIADENLKLKKNKAKVGNQGSVIPIDLKVTLGKEFESEKWFFQKKVPRNILDKIVENFPSKTQAKEPNEFALS